MNECLGIILIGRPQGVAPTGNVDVGCVWADPCGRPQRIAPTGNVDVGCVWADPCGRPQRIAPTGNVDVGCVCRGDPLWSPYQIMPRP